MILHLAPGPDPIQLVVTPVGHHRPGRFHVALASGVPLPRSTRQPLFDGARALLKLGHDPERLIEVSHLGSAIVAMRATVGEAARWLIEEPDRGGLRKRLWKPNDFRSGRAS